MHVNHPQVKHSYGVQPSWSSTVWRHAGQPTRLQLCCNCCGQTMTVMYKDEGEKANHKLPGRPAVLKLSTDREGRTLTRGEYIPRFCQQGLKTGGCCSCCSSSAAATPAALVKAWGAPAAGASAAALQMHRYAAALVPAAAVRVTKCSHVLHSKGGRKQTHGFCTARLHIGFVKGLQSLVCAAFRFLAQNYCYQLHNAWQLG